MSEVHAALEAASRPSAVDVLATLAPAVHGPNPLGDKLAWAADALRSMTRAHLAAYVELRKDGNRLVGVAGVTSYEVEAFARPALARAVARLGPATAITAGDLEMERRWRLFLEHTDLPPAADALGVPVPSDDGRPHGVLLVCHPEPHHFDTDDQVAAEALAAHLGVALDNEARLAELRELHQLQREVVHQLQEAVRPPIPDVDAVELGVHYLPADRSAPTGGDLHDWLVLADGDVFLSVVDIMGKGVAATKDALAVTHALRLLVLDGCPIDRLIARADALLTAHNPDLVATVIVARYRPSDGCVWLAGGGQPPALVVSAAGDARLVSAPGIAIGWPGAGSSEVVELTLDRNETLVLYTDGLIESTKDVIAGLENLQRAASQIAQYPSNHVARALVDRSLSGAMRRDDSLALVLRRRTAPPFHVVAPLAPFEYCFSPNAATIPLARHLFADWLEHLPVEESERGDLLLVASELCSNAVRHATGAPTALALRAWAEGDAIVVEVQDDGVGFEPTALYDDETPDPDAERGRGLYVVEALTDEMSVRREDEQTYVRAVRRAVLPAVNA